MKRFLKIFVPLVLAIGVLACAAWYLLVYDRDFTRDMLLSWARYCESQGNHSTAAWFYDLAYNQADQDESVAIELAEQYKSIGNYTKAEYTLSKAISDGGSTELYVALCKTYVEQDKLLDAVSMLENVADPTIKAELEAMRPSAPTADMESGFYSQYISVALSSSAGTLYVNTEGEYPTIADPPYSGPIALGQGETVIYAISVADNGLVSPVSVFGYTVGGVIEEVVFADPAMEGAIRVMLGAADNVAVFTDQLWQITEFTMPEDVSTYEDLSRMTCLKTLTIENGVPGELHFLSSLTQLETLKLTGCTPTEDEISAIASLPALRSLTMDGCGLSTIAGLENAQQLTYLDLRSNAIRNITPLSGLADLQELYMAHNALTDLSELSALSNLQKLDVSYNSLTSIAPICSLVGLQRLNVAHNELTDLAAVDNLTALTHLFAGNNSLTDVSALARCGNLVELDLSNNTITDIAALNTLTNITYFNFSYNQVAELPAFAADCALVHIDGSYNQLSSLEPLKGLKSLNDVYMDYNSEITDVECLATCPVLIKVNVFGTQVREVSALTDQSIIVNYNPT